MFCVYVPSLRWAVPMWNPEGGTREGIQSHPGALKGKIYTLQ